MQKADAIRAYLKIKKSRQRPTLARASPALPSAMEPLTSVFGMGTGMTTPLWPPAKTDFASRNQMQISNLKSQISSGDLRCLDVIQDVLRSDPHDCKASWELKRITTRHEMRGMISHCSEVQRFGRFGRFGRSMELSKPSEHPDFPNLRFRRKRIS